MNDDTSTKGGTLLALAFLALAGAFAMKTAKEKLVGGVADDVEDEEFDSEELLRGTTHEMEHTEDPETAKEIAKDHLAEDEEYYEKLEE